jgi:hypothetical protein
MLPAAPSSGEIREPPFALEEWMIAMSAPLDV